MAPELAMVAGEASGDMLAAHVLHALRDLRPQWRAAGIGGAAMQREGLSSWWPLERLAVNGFAAVLPRLPELLWMRASLRRRLLREPPAVFVGVDAPDFNLALEQGLRDAAIPTVHFISPSIWAWRRERIHRIERAVDRLLCVFPFEPQLYAGTRVHASYIGHPLAEVVPLQPDRGAARAALGLDDAAPVIAVLPGSRRGEVQHIGAAFLGAAAQLQRRRGARIVVPVAQPQLAPLLQRQAQAWPQLQVHWLDGGAQQALAACDAALVASGTATLECALFKRPMVIGYRLPALSWWLMKDRGYLPWVGLPNILAGASLVPELLQHACTPTALADALLAQLDDAPRCAELHERFTAMHEQLRRPTAQLAAQAIAEVAREGARR